MISAFARAAQILEDRNYRACATRAAEFIRQNSYRANDASLRRSYRDGPAEIDGFADDYAFYIRGLLDLYEASFDVKWLRLAEKLQATQESLFWDEKGGGYFSNSAADANILLRLKEDNDNAEPAASSVAASNLLRLSQIRSDEKLRTRAERTIAAFALPLQHFPSALPQMLVELDDSLTTSRQIVIAGKHDQEDTRALLREVHQHFLPNTIVLLADGGEGQEFLAEKLPEIRAMKTLSASAAAYVCENFTCKSPVISPHELRKLLAR